jgi:hypothetical protein
MITDLRTILLAEDNANDIELTLAALATAQELFHIWGEIV